MTSSLPPPPGRPAPPTPPPRRRSRGIWIGLGLVAVGGLAVVAWLAFTLPEVGARADDLRRAEAGRPAELEITGDGADWDIFIEPSGRSQSGVRFEIRDRDGELMPIGRAGSGGASYDWFGRSGRSIAAVELPPGHYTLTVIAGDATIAIGEDPTDVIARAIGGAAALGLPLILGGIALAVVSAIRDTRLRTQRAEPPPPSPWSAGEWPAERGR